MQGLSISSGLMYWGLASFIDMDWEKVSDSTDPGHDLAERLLLGRRRAADYEFIHVHSKAPDVAGHSKDPFNKVAAIESLADVGLRDEISIVPFPINFPELYHYYLPMRATFFLTIYNEWGDMGRSGTPRRGAAGERI
jgi:hypothetical protein